MSDELDFYIVDDIPEYVFIIADDEEQEQYIALKGEAGGFKYEKVAELPATGEDGVLYLVPKSHETLTASGNPININVTEGAGKLTDLQLNGDTAQQTFSGKNLFDYNSASDTSNTFVSTYRLFEIDGLEPNTTYMLSGLTFSSTSDMTGKYLYLWTGTTYETKDPAAFIADGTVINNSRQFTTDATGKRYLAVYPSDTTTWTSVLNFMKKCQIEKGSTATSYEPYVGGTPSPSPNYPQNINVVTGTQTISINGTSYPIDLGDIELADIGTYQDYIYPSNGDWYVKKQIGKLVLDGTNAGITWSRTVVGGTKYAFWFRNSMTDALMAKREKKCDKFAYTSEPYTTAPAPILCENEHDTPTSTMFIFNTDGSQGTTLDEWETWLSSNNVTVYYPLATATDTKITDTSLIAQLEAVRTAQLANGTNPISNTATGDNLAGDLELSYYEYDPTNKYNKWLWLADDAAYEQM